MDNFSERLQKLVYTEKISQQDVADGIGVDKSRISAWLNGKVKKPRKSTLYSIADFFGCDVRWLATGEGEPWPIDDGFKPELYKPEDFVQATKEEEMPQVRMYRKLAQMDEDTLGEIQTWLNDMERLRPGFKSWFRLEFQNRFPEFDEWKEKITKNSKTGTSD